MAYEHNEMQSGASIKKLLSFFSCCGSTQNGWVVEPSRNAPQISPSPRDIENFNNPNPEKETLQPAESKPPNLSKSEERDEEHTLYCPICMYFFEEIQKTRCCSHHICLECHYGIVQRKRRDSGLADRCPICQVTFTFWPNTSDRSSTGGTFISPACPHCNAPELEITHIMKGSDSRRYEDSPAVQKKPQIRLDLKTVPISPLKIGDSYEVSISLHPKRTTSIHRN
jgi:hypothetical protein